MKKIERVALLGLGSLGVMYAAKISRTIGRGLEIIARGVRAERYRREGVSLNGEKLDLAIVDPKDASPADLIIFTTKFGGLADAIEDARGAIRDDTIILSQLNGVTSESIIDEAYGEGHTLLSLTVGTDATRVGNDVRLKTFGRIQFGEAKNDPAAPTERVAAVKALLDSCGLDSETPDDMRWAQWKKFMMNVGLNQTMAVLGCTYEGVNAAGEGRKLCEDAMREAVAVSRAEGVMLEESDVDAAMAVVATLAPEGKCSMLQDVEARRKTELGLFGGTVVRLAKKHGISAPVNEMYVRIITALEEGFARAK